jgi:very-short-patch-repair endonuclease
MFRERMHPRVSAAEIEVFKALSVGGLTGGLVTQREIVLKVTVPDFCWPELRKVVYLDGSQVHAKSKVEARDEEIDCLLELQGWQVLRIRYDAPLSKAGLQQVMAKIRGFLGLEGST